MSEDLEAHPAARMPHGEFVGGADIIREMFQAGELKSLLETKGVAAAAPAA